MQANRGKKLKTFLYIKIIVISGTLAHSNQEQCLVYKKSFLKMLIKPNGSFWDSGGLRMKEI